MTWLSGNPPQSRVEIGSDGTVLPGADARPPPCETRATVRESGGGEGRGDDLRGTGLRGARGLRGAGLRDRRRAGRARHRAGARPAAAGGCCCSRAAGGRRGAAAQALSQAENLDPATHHAPEITVARRLGGASNLWGGRCLPFDPVDFARPALARRAAGLADRAGGSRALARRRPARLLAAGDAGVRRAAARGGGRPAFGFESLERWSNRPRIQELHRAELAARPDLLVALGATVTRLRGRRGRADRGGRRAPRGAGQGADRRAARGAGRRRQREHAAAARGAAPAPERFGGPEGPLGRCYMGHVNGTIADVVLREPGAARRARLPCRRPWLLRAAAAGAVAGDAGGGRGSATSPSGRWCPRSPNPATGRGRSRRSSWRSRSGRSGGG